MEKITGFFSPVLIYLLILLLHFFLPARRVTGYVTKANSTQKLKYRLNGIYVFFIAVVIWYLAGFFKIAAWDLLYTYRWYGLAGAFTFGIIFSLAIVLPNSAVSTNFLKDFYLGRLDNPQGWNNRIDAKMWLYLIGAILLALNTLSFTVHHWILYGVNASAGIYLSAGLIIYFVIDYLSFEEVHLYTYDIIAEKVGFKLGWGCIAFYPYFYSIVLWSTVDLPNPKTPVWLLIIYVLIFFTGWCLARGANMQKYFFKKNSKRSFLGIVPESITDGKSFLLVNGFWGLSRHINYLGEILMGTGIALCVGHPFLIWPWLYPLYYVALLFPRQIDDDKRCALKYGELWKQYVNKVPYRIIPFIY